jgi:hypothetical protein
MISFAKVELECNRGDKLQVLNEDRDYLLYDQCHQIGKKANNKTVINFALAKGRFIVVRLQTISNRTISAAFDVVLIDSAPEPVRPLRQQGTATVVSAAAVVSQRPPFLIATTKITKALNHC